MLVLMFFIVEVHGPFSSCAYLNMIGEINAISDLTGLVHLNLCGNKLNGML